MFRAIKSFVGKITMNVDDTIEELEKDIAKDLIQAGYIVEEKARENKVAPKVEEQEEVVAPKVQNSKKTKTKK